MLQIKHSINVQKRIGPRIRTHDFAIMSLLLYPLEQDAHCSSIHYFNFALFRFRLAWHPTYLCTFWLLLNLDINRTKLLRCGLQVSYCKEIYQSNLLKHNLCLRGRQNMTYRGNRDLKGNKMGVEMSEREKIGIRCERLGEKERER